MHVKTAFCIIINAPFIIVLGYWDGEYCFQLPLKVYFLVVWGLRTAHNTTFFGGKNEIVYGDDIYSGKNMGTVKVPNTRE